MTDIAFAIVRWGGVFIGYLVLGWVSGQIFMKVMTDGYWENENAFGPHRIVRTKMGVGTGMAWLLLWPIMWVVVALVFIIILAGKLFSHDFWKKVFRL